MNLSVLAEQIAQQDAIEWLGLFTGIVYVILAAYERPVCWIFGIISCGCIAWKSFADYKLMADVGLQTFYILIGFLGLWNWVAKRESGIKPIVTMTVVRHLTAIGIILLISYPVSIILIRYAGAKYGYLDTSLTLLSVWATLLLVKKDLHNWIYWIVVDILYTGLYWRSKGYLFALLYLIFAIIAVWGWKKWKQQMELR